MAACSRTSGCLLRRLRKRPSRTSEGDDISAGLYDSATFPILSFCRLCLRVALERFDRQSRSGEACVRVEDAKVKLKLSKGRRIRDDVCSETLQAVFSEGISSPWLSDLSLLPVVQRSTCTYDEEVDEPIDRKRFRSDQAGTLTSANSTVYLQRGIQLNASNTRSSS